MDKNAIQKYAIWARNELIAQVKQRAFQFGISDKGYGEENASVINGHVLTSDEKRQRQDFVHEIQKNGFEQAVEEVAYTWFNRFVALRFMEVNDYLPTHVRVFSDASGGFNPEILKNVLHLDLEGLDKAKVSTLLNANQTEELYRYLLLTQCNALNAALPEMFERLGSFTELLLPNNILKQDSVLARLVKDIDDDNFNVLKTGQVEIIGWMYQYYNTEPKQAVFDGLKKNIKITKEKIPAATQLFTPDWIVRYMVENSLGRLWLEGHPNDKLKTYWKYYLDEAEQMPEVAERLRVIRAENPMKSPEDIRLIDPCMGSGHILVYAFDVLMQIYESEGYNTRDAAKLILEKNIYGLDIDRRAYQLANFSLMMKARQYNRRIFTEDIKPQVYHPTGFPEGEEYGSLLKVDELPPKPIEKAGQLRLGDTDYNSELRVWNFLRLLAQKYDVVVTNPPYMGSSGMSAKMSDFVKKHYPDGKSDLFAVFIERCGQLLKSSGYQAMITQPSFLFLSSFEKLRVKIIENNTISNLIHMGRGIFGIDFGSTAFIIKKQNVLNYTGCYFKLHERTFQYIDPDDIAKLYLMSKGNTSVKYDFSNYDTKTEDISKDKFSGKELQLYYETKQENFEKIPGSSVAYWVSEAMLKAFERGNSIESYSTPRQGMGTGDNDHFLRIWWEVEQYKMGYGLRTLEEADTSNLKWFPYNKGGDFRKWYGNNEYVVNFKNDGSEVKASVMKKYPYLKTPDFVIKNTSSFFKECITWSQISSGSIAFRYKPVGFISGGGAASIFQSQENLYYLQGACNSKVMQTIATLLSPTLNFEINQVKDYPVIEDKNKKTMVNELVTSNIALSRIDWDAFETSWDFKKHPLIFGERTVAAAFTKREREAAERFNTLKANEEELNRIFIDIYGLQDELTPEVEDKEVTVRRADLGREVRSLISYAVGCMFGRYSLDTEGLAYAGGEWDASKYSTFIPDKDNILPICDDEYFEDDIVGRFVDFIRLAYGTITLEENLKFIADALGGKGTPREVIRSYFLNDFFTDHCKIYQKRPIYWLFDSGKKNGFKALVYLHRYSRDLLAKMRTDYVHEQQERYRTQLSHIAAALNTATGAERAKLLKQQDKLAEQLKEITAFEEKVHHLADQNITIDLDDGVKKNYEIFADVLAKI